MRPAMMARRCCARWAPAVVAGVLVALWGCDGAAGNQAESDRDELAGPDATASGQELESAATPPPFHQLSSPFGEGTSWGMLAEGRSWGQVSAIGTAPDGRHVWVADRCGSACLGKDVPSVLMLDLDGEVVRSFGGSMFVRPHGMHVEEDGSIWVTDVRSPSESELEEHPEEARKGHAVYKFSPEGQLLLTLGTPGEPGDPPQRLTQPNDVITAPDGSIYVAEGHSNDGPIARISRFDAEGGFVESWGRLGDEPGEFRTPHALAFDSRGRLFVADRGNSRIQIFDANGGFLDAWYQFGRPNDVAIDGSDRLYAPDSESGDERNPEFLRGIYIGDAATGEVAGLIPPLPMEGRPQGTTGEGVTLDAQGNLYSAEVALRGLTRYAPR